MVSLHCEMQWGPLVVISQVHIRRLRENQCDTLLISTHRRQMKDCQPFRVLVIQKYLSCLFDKSKHKMREDDVISLCRGEEEEFVKDGIATRIGPRQTPADILQG